MNTTEPARTTPPPSSRMALALTALVVGSFASAATVGPAVHGILTRALLPAMPFSRAFDRTALVTAVLLLVMMRRPLGLSRVVEAWRGRSPAGIATSAAVAFALAAGPAIAALALAVPASGLGWAGRSAGAAVAVAAMALLPALVIALVEESFFRAIVFRGLASTWPIALAVPAGSVFYSVLHFLQPPPDFVLTGSAADGFRYLGLVLQELFTTATLPAVLGLILVGSTLCLVLARAGSLALCIGLHAGWIVAIKVAILLTTLPLPLKGGGSVAKRALLLGDPWVWLAVAMTACAALAVAPRLGKAEQTTR